MENRVSTENKTFNWVQKKRIKESGLENSLHHKREREKQLEMAAQYVLSTHANVALNWVNEIMMNTINTNKNVRNQINGALMQNTQDSNGGNTYLTARSINNKNNINSYTPLQSVSDLSSIDYAQLIVAIRPHTNTRFTFAPSNSTPKEIHEAHLKNYRSAVSEMADLISFADAVGAPSVRQLTSVAAAQPFSSSSSFSGLSSVGSTTSDPRLSLPQRLCQGDIAAHNALLNAIYSQRRLFPMHEYDWAKARQRLEEKELMPDGQPLAWVNQKHNGGASSSSASSSCLLHPNMLDPNRSISVSHEDRLTSQLLTTTTNHLENALKIALSLPIYLCPCGTTNTKHDSQKDENVKRESVSSEEEGKSEGMEGKENKSPFCGTARVAEMDSKKGNLRGSGGGVLSDNNKLKREREEPQNPPEQNHLHTRLRQNSENGKLLLTQEPMSSELFALMLLALGETAEEATLQL